MGNEQQRHQVEEELAARHVEWRRAVESSDVDAYADIVCEDVLWVAPAGPAIIGRKAFRNWLEPFFRDHRYEFVTHAQRYRIAGAWVAESLSFESRMTPVNGGAPLSHTGTCLILWRRDFDGRWRIDRYIDAS